MCEYEIRSLLPNCTYRKYVSSSIHNQVYSSLKNISALNFFLIQLILSFFRLPLPISRLTSAYYLLPFTFYFLPSAVYHLPFTFSLLPSSFLFSHHQPPVCETAEPVCRNNNMIMHCNADNLPCLHKLFGNSKIILAGFRIAAGMVVHKNNCCCRL